MAIGIAKTPLAKNRVFNRSDPIWNTLEELLLNLCVYFITSACETPMGGKGIRNMSEIFKFSIWISFSLEVVLGEFSYIISQTSSCLIMIEFSPEVVFN